MRGPFRLKAIKLEKRSRWRVVWKRIRALAASVWRWILRSYRWLSGELRRRAVLARLQRADIILASPRTLRLTPIGLLYRLLLRARYVHSMMYVGDGKVIHTTTKHGVVVAPLPRKIHRQDRYTILRMPDLGPEQAWRLTREALKLRGRRLDQAGLLTNVPARLLGLRKPLVRLEANRLWCSKLIQRAYSAVGIDLVPQTRAETVTSEDLSQSPLLEKI